MFYPHSYDPFGYEHPLYFGNPHVSPSQQRERQEVVQLRKTAEAERRRRAEQKRRRRMERELANEENRRISDAWRRQQAQQENFLRRLALEKAMRQKEEEFRRRRLAQRRRRKASLDRFPFFSETAALPSEDLSNRLSKPAGYHSLDRVIIRHLGLSPPQETEEPALVEENPDSLAEEITSRSSPLGAPLPQSKEDTKLINESLLPHIIEFNHSDDEDDDLFQSLDSLTSHATNED